MIREITKSDLIAEHNEEAIVLDGLDEAIVGITTTGIVAYSVDEILNILITRDDMHPDEARDFFGYNIECLNIGQYSPIFIEGI